LNKNNYLVDIDMPCRVDVLVMCRWRAITGSVMPVFLRAGI